MLNAQRQTWIVPTLCLALGFTAAAHADSSSGAVYKWTDDKGVVHYGDSVPSEFAQKERSVLNSQGVEVGHVEGVKSAAQLEAQAQAEEQARQQAQHDQFLLSTYLSTKDIEQLRDQRLDQIDGQIKASQVYIESLGSRLTALQDRALRFKPYNSDPNARRMPDELVEDLVRTSGEARSQKLALDAKRKEQVDVRASFQSDIERYRQLTSHQQRP